MLKKTLAVLMAVCFILMAFTACAKPTAPAPVATQAPASEASAAPAATSAPAEQKVVIGLIMINLTHPFHRGEMEGAKECARRYGVELRIVSGDDDVNKQIQAFENLVSQKVNAISVNCIDVNAFGPAFQKAKDAGVDVRLTVGEGLFHCYPVMEPMFPEATQAIKEICDFIKKHVNKG
jgi:ABC-type sugar transport system substrate-binding protein